MRRRSLAPDELAAWCRWGLGAEPTDVLFEAGHLSTVIGIRLADRREVVVKARPAPERINACVQVQRHLWRSGFPCPEPLAGPAPLGELAATAEVYVAGGELLEAGPDSPQRFAELLAELVRLA